MEEKIVIIIGGGVAGLSAAYSLLQEDSNYKPIIFEQEDTIGGLSKTINYDGNLIDIGPHRFFSKDQSVMNFWKSILPMQGEPAKDDMVLGRDIHFEGSTNPEQEDKSMLKRRRFSRIYYNKKFFDYPVKMNLKTIFNLGFFKTAICGFSYIKSCFYKRKEVSLEDFMINRFGKVLYQIFFEFYTQKVWGRHPRNISKEWGAQRIKGLSLLKALLNKLSSRKETSLIEEYIYPKLGASQLWEEMASEILKLGGEIHKNSKVISLKIKDSNIVSVVVQSQSGIKEYNAEYIISSMPIRDLVSSINEVPFLVKDIAQNLPYRDYILVSHLLSDLNLKNNTDWPTLNNICPDSWIYVQDREVTVGRLYIPKNFTPYICKNEKDILLGMEYFASQDDFLWQKTDEEIFDYSIKELLKLGAIKSKSDVLKSYRLNIKDAYPAYFDSYKDFDIVKRYLNTIDNLYCIGRNGQHKYNNMDHSTLSGILAAQSILTGTAKEALWEINTEKDYQEIKK